MKYVIVGAGIWGCTMANLISTELQEPVLLIDKRGHIGGNCYTELHPSTGIEYHKYGSHIFHTSKPHVWKYLNQFTEFTNYKHVGYTLYQDKVYNFPVNLKTINDFYGINLQPFQVESFIKAERTKYMHSGPIQNLEEMAISLIGQPLYEAFVKGYTIKQWQIDPKLLPKEIIQRLPIRYNYNSSYFNDDFHQGLPLHGYTKMFEKMVQDNPLITIQLDKDWKDLERTLDYHGSFILYSGPIDEYFNYELGRLQYRSLDFQYETKELKDFQGTSIINYADVTVPYTRIHEFKHLHPERVEVMESGQTLLCYEYSKNGLDNDLLYYPVNTSTNQELYEKYRAKLNNNDANNNYSNVLISGRLGSYRYLDMDKVVDDAMNCFKDIKAKL